MKIYLVGGAVRDQLLNRPVTERDWVIVGATPEQLLEQGFQPVGKDFPVFLHPKTHEEYALARTERKIGRGYKGFQFYADPSVSLIEDLSRRDLTINAMALSETGELIDPFQGQNDLKEKWLRHVSPAFIEDPVRILRLARFAARFPDFNAHPDTLALMRVMVNNGEVDALVAERVWQELQRALTEVAPARFFAVLESCDAQKKLFPGLQRDASGIRLLAQHAADHSAAHLRWALCVSPLLSAEIQALNKRYRIPNQFTWLPLLWWRLQDSLQQLLQGVAADFGLRYLIILEQSDAFRRPERLQDLLTLWKLCRPDARTIMQSDNILRALQAVQGLDLSQITQQAIPGAAIAQAIRQARLRTITTLLRNSSLSR